MTEHPLSLFEAATQDSPGSPPSPDASAPSTVSLLPHVPVPPTIIRVRATAHSQGKPLPQPALEQEFSPLLESKEEVLTTSSAMKSMNPGRIRKSLQRQNENDWWAGCPKDLSVILELVAAWGRVEQQRGWKPLTLLSNHQESSPPYPHNVPMASSSNDQKWQVYESAGHPEL